MPSLSDQILQLESENGYTESPVYQRTRGFMFQKRRFGDKG